MRIRTQFIITILLFGVTLVIIAGSAIITHRRVEKAGEQEKIASSIAQGASELSYLSNDYLVYRESQQRKRWQSKLASLSSEVGRLRAEEPEHQAHIRDIQANAQRLKEVFDSVVSAIGSPSQDPHAALETAFLQVSWSRMAVQSQGLVSDATRLSQLLHQQRDQLTTTRTILIYITVVLFGVFLLASYMLTYRRILKSIATLQAGTAVIGSGNLDFIIEEKKKDEIGDLSHAFNQMTTDLKAVTASKADLESEVTERKRAEEDLRKQREWLRVTLSSIGDAVIATDTQGRITYLNPVAITLTGWQREEALGRSIEGIFRIINEKTRVPAEDLVARVLSEKRVVALANDTALVTRDGREIPIEDSAAPILDATGNIIGVVLAFHDVAVRRRTQAALRESEERFRAVFESSSDCILVWDRQYNYLYANQAAIDHVGTTRDKVIGKNIRDGLGHLSDFMRLWMGRVDRAFATGESFRVEDAVPVGDRPVYSESQVSPIRDATGQVFAVGVVYRDITERKQAEAALQEAHERAAWLARFPDENPNPVVRVSVDGCVLYCNSASVEIPGWALEVGQPLPQPLLPLVGQAMTENKDIERDLQLGERLYSVSVAPFPEEGYANVYGRDITNRKLAEEALRQRTLELQHLTETLEQRVQDRTEELAEANQALRQLSIRLLSAHEEERKRIAGELHDTIGACLSGIKFKVEDTLQRMGKKADVETQSLKTIVPVIQEAVEECRRIQLDLRPSMLDDLGLLPTLSWFSRKFQTIYSRIRVDQKVTIEESDIPDSLKIVIYRIIQEAMNNCAKHSEADSIYLCLQKIDGNIELLLEDNGQGFDPRKALDTESTKRGLGLTSMRERAELSCGSFDIESMVGKGTIIRARWPI